MKTCLLICCAALAAVSAALAAPSVEVTLRVEQFNDAPNRTFRFRYSGTVPSADAGETVTILGKACGTNYWTSVAGTSTAAGGAYQVVAPTPNQMLTVAPPASYRARWGSSFSDPVTLRSKLWLVATRVARLRYQAVVNVLPTVPLNLQGRLVEVQRLVDGRWGRIKVARFVPASSSGYNKRYTATFTVPAGATLRVYVPARAAGPCFEGTLSKEFRT